jgi:hypothetical protein
MDRFAVVVQAAHTVQCYVLVVGVKEVKEVRCLFSMGLRANMVVCC